LKDISIIFYEQFKAISYVEWFGVITGALCVYLAVKENILNWPVSILSIVAYVYIFYHSKLYGDTVLQLYFLATAVYGWYYWSYGNIKAIKSDRPIVKVSNQEWLILISLLILLSGLVGYLLNKYTDTDVPYIDGFCTITSFIAQFLMMRKKLENWLVWIFVDAIYIPLYIHKGLFATALLYFLFLFIALKGFLDWKKKLKLSYEEASH
jgi:nicotinamide mononucleotide transporter